MLPAYQQPYNFTATDLSNGDTRISWNVSGSVASQQTGDQFEVERSATPGFNTVVPVGKLNYDPNTTSYSLIDETSKYNINGTIYYRIRRTKTAANWQWSEARTTSIVKSMHHVYIASAHASLVLSENVAHITWQYDGGNVWSENTEIILVRNNLNTAQVQTMTIPADSLTNRSYSEELYQMCNEYEYKIYVKPGNTAYAQQSQLKVNVDPENRIIPIEMGTLVSADASKGYFSTHTELTWTTDGLAIDLFAIKRRHYNSGEVFKQIELINASDAATNYQYNDATGNPGEIYEYEIVGLVNCADGTRETDPLYSYGFRTPTGDIYGRVTFQNGQAEQNVQLIVEGSDGLIGKSMVMDAGTAATIDDPHFMEDVNDRPFTLQAWISPDQTDGLRKIIARDGMFELAISDGHFRFKAGTDVLTSAATVNSLSRFFIVRSRFRC